MKLNLEIIELDGDLNHQTVPFFQKKMNEFNLAGEEIILDLKNVQYVNSAGIAFLLWLKDKHNDDITLANLTPNLKKLLETLRLDKYCFCKINNDFSFHTKTIKVPNQTT